MNVTVKRVRLLDGANSSVVKAKASAGKGSCAVWSVLDPLPNHRFFQAKVDSQWASSLKQAKSHMYFRQFPYSAFHSYMSLSMPPRWGSTI